MTELLSADELEQRLRQIGEERYHDKHPFHCKLHAGALSRGQLQAWVLNRYYYQSRIPLKDAALLSRVDDREFRREWIRRILDHDGEADDSGGIERWLVMAEGVGLDREAVKALTGVLPATRFAVDAYVNFARRAPWQEAVCASLTELFAPQIHKQRLANWPEHYSWIDSAGLHYFQSRVSLARRDVEFSLAVTLDQFTTRAAQERALEILQFKLDVLWQMNDALAQRYGVQA